MRAGCRRKCSTCHQQGVYRYLHIQSNEKEADINMASLLGLFELLLERDCDSDEVGSLESGASDETAVDVWLCEELLCV